MLNHFKAFKKKITGIKRPLKIGENKLFLVNRNGKSFAAQTVLTLLSFVLICIVVFWPSDINNVIKNKKQKTGQYVNAVNSGNVICLKGTDNLNRRFVLNSTHGEQMNDKKIMMNQINMTFFLKNGDKINMQGNYAIYDAKKNQMNISGNVRVTHSNGLNFVTTAAFVDLNNGTASNNLPLEITSNNTKMHSRGFRFSEKEQQIVFTGSPEVLSFKET